MAIVSLAMLQTSRLMWQQHGIRIVLTNGVFDLLHAGHVEYLEQARALGDLLIVGINSDDSTRTIKGPLRPITLQNQRATVLAALRCVDYVTIFEQQTAEELVRSLRPDIYVKGGDYAVDIDISMVIDVERLPEARIVQHYGGQALLLPYSSGKSTTALIKCIIERFGPTAQTE